MMLKRAISLVLVLVMSVFIFTACGSTGQSTTTSGSSKSAEASASSVPSDQPVTLSFITWRGDDKAANDKIIENFNEKYPNIKVNFEYDQGGEAHHQLIKTRLLANEVDLYAVQAGEHWDYLKSGNAYDLTGQPFLDNYLPEALVPNTLDGKIYGACQALSSPVMFYNVDIFKKYNLNPPKSWEEFISICDTLKKAGIAPIAQGTANAYITNNMAIMLMGSLNPDQAPTALKDLYEGNIKLTDEPIATTHKLLKQLADDGYYAQGHSGTDKFGAAALFAQGKAAMCVEGTWRSSTLEETANLNYDMFSVPALGGKPDTYINHPNQTHIINPNSKHIKEALLLYDFMSSKESMTIYSEMTNQIPAGKDISVDSKAVNKALAFAKGKTAVLDPFVQSPASEFSNDLYNYWQAIAIGADFNKATADMQTKIDSYRK